MSRKKIYISGKMGVSTITNAIWEKFDVAESLLHDKGWIVVNPADQKYQLWLNRYLTNSRAKGEKEKYVAALFYDMRRLSRCDAIYMLKDWKDSPGATAEHYFAKAIGLKILYEDEYYT